MYPPVNTVFCSPTNAIRARELVDCYLAHRYGETDIQISCVIFIPDTRIFYRDKLGEVHTFYLTDEEARDEVPRTVREEVEDLAKDGLLQHSAISDLGNPGLTVLRERKLCGSGAEGECSGECDKAAEL